MKASLIIAVYKDLTALELIIEALSIQTYKNFEVIIAEDGENLNIKNYISNIKNLNIIHTTQEDIGIRKSRSINKAIIRSTGDYLIFIDGDCIPYSTFIESHISLSENGFVLSGRRVNLGPKYSQKLRDNKIKAYNLENKFWLYFPFLTFDSNEGHTEEGFRFTTNSFIYKNILKKLNRTKSLLGCNFSCFKKDMVEINGYDEGYKESAVSTDTDLEWRFKALGLKIKSSRNVANMFHLNHKKNNNFYKQEKEAFAKMKQNIQNNKFVCELGISKHKN